MEQARQHNGVFGTRLHFHFLAPNRKQVVERRVCVCLDAPCFHPSTCAANGQCAHCRCMRRAWLVATATFLHRPIIRHSRACVCVCVERCGFAENVPQNILSSVKPIDSYRYRSAFPRFVASRVGPAEKTKKCSWQGGKPGRAEWCGVDGGLNCTLSAVWR